MKDLKLHPMQYTYRPDEPYDGKVICGVCEEEIVGTPTDGPRNFLESVSKRHSPHVSYVCHHASETWHKQILVLRYEACETASANLAEILLREAQVIANTHVATRVRLGANNWDTPGNEEQKT